jgi:hypothetical protein
MHWRTSIGASAARLIRADPNHLTSRWQPTP